MVACFTDFLKSGLIVQKHTSSVSKFLMFYGVGKKKITFYGGVFYRVFEVRTHCPDQTSSVSKFLMFYGASNKIPYVLWLRGYRLSGGAESLARLLTLRAATPFTLCLNPTNQPTVDHPNKKNCGPRHGRVGVVVIVRGFQREGCVFKSRMQYKLFHLHTVPSAVLLVMYLQIV